MLEIGSKHMYDLLQISGSTMLNLSLLTSDMWSIVIRIVAYNEKVHDHLSPSPCTFMSRILFV